MAQQKKEKDTLKRRTFLARGVSVGVGLGLGAWMNQSCTSNGTTKTQTRPKGNNTCNVTESNIEGPYYRTQPPWKTAIADAKEPGIPLVISGIVYGPDCQTPLAGAIVDVWQANEKGSYDNDGNNDPPNGEYKLRGRMKTNDKGEYEYTTIVPGRYLNGATYRPAHIHYKVSEPNHQELTTQLYFKGDPYIAKDPFVHASLVINLTAHNKGKKGQFDIVLKKKS